MDEPREFFLVDIELYNNTILSQWAFRIYECYIIIHIVNLGSYFATNYWSLLTKSVTTISIKKYVVKINKLCIYLSHIRDCGRSVIGRAFICSDSALLLRELVECLSGSKKDSSLLVKRKNVQVMWRHSKGMYRGVVMFLIWMASILTTNVTTTNQDACKRPATDVNRRVKIYMRLFKCLWQRFTIDYMYLRSSGNRKYIFTRFFGFRVETFAVWNGSHSDGKHAHAALHSFTVTSHNLNVFRFTNCFFLLLEKALCWFW